MANGFFHAVHVNSKIGKGTIADLVTWLEKYANVLFPENGIDYFAINQFRDIDSAFLPDDSVPSCKTADIHRIACFCNQGSSEGQRIEVAIGFADYVFRQVCSIKSFGSNAESWQIARAMEEALSSIIFYEEVPEIVSMAEKLPREGRYSRETNLTGTVVIRSTKDSVRVAVNGQLFDQRSWKHQHPGNAKYAVEAVVKDWRTVLTNMRANFMEEAAPDEEVVIREDLPGYYITNRGEPGATGFYILPPGGRFLSNDFIGVFPDVDSAVSAATNHKNQAKAKAQAKAA